MTSKTFNTCETMNHKRISESPNGIDVLETCFTCKQTWMIKGFNGEVILLPQYFYRYVKKYTEEKSK